MTELEEVWCATPGCNKQVSINLVTGEWFHTKTSSHYCLPDSLERAKPRDYVKVDGKWEKIQHDEDSVKEEETNTEIKDPYQRFQLGKYAYVDVHSDRILIVDRSGNMTLLDGVEALRLLNALQDTVNLDVTFKIEG